VNWWIWLAGELNWLAGELNWLAGELVELVEL
jgi:hypothetical protein